MMYKKNYNNGEIEKKRRNQNVFWLKKYIVSEYIDLIKQKKYFIKTIGDYEKKSLNNPRKEALKIIQKLI